MRLECTTHSSGWNAKLIQQSRTKFTDQICNPLLSKQTLHPFDGCTFTPSDIKLYQLDGIDADPSAVLVQGPRRHNHLHIAPSQSYRCQPPQSQPGACLLLHSSFIIRNPLLKQSNMPMK